MKNPQNKAQKKEEQTLSSSFFETYLILLNCVQCLSDICVVRLAAHVSFIGKTACGVLLNKKMPARRRAQRQDASWIRRYKSLPLQNRHPSSSSFRLIHFEEHT